MASLSAIEAAEAAVVVDFGSAEIFRFFGGVESVVVPFCEDKGKSKYISKKP